MSPIINAFDGWIDLRKVASIGFAKFHEHDSRHGYSAAVGFEILVQQCAEPIRYRRALVDGVEIRAREGFEWSSIRGYTGSHEIAVVVFGILSWAPSPIAGVLDRHTSAVLAVNNLQREIDEKLIDVWHEVART